MMKPSSQILPSYSIWQ